LLLSGGAAIVQMALKARTLLVEHSTREVQGRQFGRLIELVFHNPRYPLKYAMTYFNLVKCGAKGSQNNDLGRSFGIAFPRRRGLLSSSTGG
jgi:hypothetical protein